MVVHQIVIFVLLGGAKLVLESYAGRHINRGGDERSKGISNLFRIQGSVTPLMILAENLVLQSFVPLAVCILFALIDASMFVVRYAAIRELGNFYSVHVRICEDHLLVRQGIYSHVRHPIYLVGIVDGFAYPLACGAPLTALVLSVLGIPLILWRRNEEEKALIEKFGAEYISYKGQTWF
jgi:protein-S-isoprenylcysteine O-methyltransferase Ste14